MNKKILILVNHEMTVYNFRRELVEKLLNDGYEVIISSPSGPKIDFFKNIGCIHENIKINRHGKNILEDLKLLRNYYKLIKKTKPSVILSYTIKPNIYGGFSARINKIPYIANITGLGKATENPGILQKLTVLLYKISLKNANTIFLQNEENFEFFQNRKIETDKLQLIPGSGVNLERFKLTTLPNENEINFVFISRIMKEKGIDYYLNAASHFKKIYPKTNFHVCGFCEDDYLPILEQMDKDGTIIYHGMVSDIRTIIKDTHCIIHPTYYPEGISNVLLENAAMGRAIITTNRSGCREVVDHGVNGYLVEEKNQEELNSAIEKFISLSYEDKKIMGLSGRTKIEKEFDRNIVINEYTRKIKEIVNYDIR